MSATTTVPAHAPEVSGKQSFGYILRFRRSTPERFYGGYHKDTGVLLMVEEGCAVFYDWLGDAAKTAEALEPDNPVTVCSRRRPTVGDADKYFAERLVNYYAKQSLAADPEYVGGNKGRD
jgi:hypothetical protein